MKTICHLLVLLLLLARGYGQSVTTNYTGKATVAGLGNVVFPSGEWSLEFQRIQAPTNRLDLPDYFVFRKLGDGVERLTFLRYSAKSPARSLAHMLDTVGETMGDGIPREEQKADRSGGEIHSMRMEPPSPKGNERTIAYSFIHVRPSPAPSWLCHSFLFTQDNAAFIIVHASTSVISPETVADVQRRSEFFPPPKVLRSFE